MRARWTLFVEGPLACECSELAKGDRENPAAEPGTIRKPLFAEGLQCRLVSLRALRQPASFLIDNGRSDV